VILSIGLVSFTIATTSTSTSADAAGAKLTRTTNRPQAHLDLAFCDHFAITGNPSKPERRLGGGDAGVSPGRIYALVLELQGQEGGPVEANAHRVPA
jgi:hypothetical protein